MINRQGGVFPIMTQDNGRSVSTGHIDSACRSNRGGKNEIPDAFKPKWFAPRLATHWVKAGKNVLIVAKNV